MIIVVSTAIGGGKCGCGCGECSPLQFKAIRVMKSRMMGFAPLLSSGPGSEYRYLKEDRRESCAENCGSGKASLLCDARPYPGSLNTDSRRADICLNCIEKQEVTSTRLFNRWRGCSYISEGCELGPLMHECTIIDHTATEKKGECSPGDECCPVKESEITLSDPYTEVMLEDDVDLMRAFVDWSDLDWNMGGDVVAVDDGELIFPKGSEAMFSSYYYTDAEETYIDKGWVRISNPTDEAIDVSVVFTPVEGDPSTSEITIPAESEITLDPPDEPGIRHILARPCTGCRPTLSVECQIKEASKDASDLSGLCYFCGYMPNPDGYRDAYTRMEVEIDYNNTFESDSGTSGSVASGSGFRHYTMDTAGHTGCAGETHENPAYIVSDSSLWEASRSWSPSGDSGSIVSEYNPISAAWEPTSWEFNGNPCPGAGGSCGLIPLTPQNSEVVSGILNWCTYVASNALYTESDTSSFTETTGTCDRVEEYYLENWPGNYEQHTLNASVSATLSNRIEIEVGEPEFDLADWEAASDCHLQASVFAVSTPVNIADTIYHRKDVRHQIGMDVTCLDPEAYESFTLTVEWFEIALPERCEVAAIVSPQSRTFNITRTGAPGSYEWDMPSEIEVELSAFAALGGKNGALLMDHLTGSISNIVEA